MTKPKPKLKPFKRVMWGLYSAHGYILWHDRYTPTVFDLRKDACGMSVGKERVARVLVTIRPVAGRGKK